MARGDEAKERLARAKKSGVIETPSGRYQPKTGGYSSKKTGTYSEKPVIPKAKPKLSKERPGIIGAYKSAAKKREERTRKAIGR